MRYLALRHLLGCPETDGEVQETRTAIRSSAPVRRIFARQAPGGYWGDPSTPYLPKYRATYWTLMVLGYLCMSRSDERVRRAVDYLSGFQQADGGFAECSAVGAQRSYDYVAQRLRVQGKSPPDEEKFLADHVHQMTYSCLTGNVASALLRLGYGDDPRLWRAIDWLVQIQHDDGGWKCPYWKAHVRDRHSCFYGTICTMEAFSEIPAGARPPAVEGAIAGGAEFLLLHRLYRADHHQGKIIHPGWMCLAFPWFYGYSILRGLWVLARLGYRDERMEDALAVLEQKCTADGWWILESTPQGRMQADLEKKGEPSKWLTLHALWTLSLLDSDQE